MKPLKLSTEFKVGVIAILTLALLYWGFNFMKGKSLFQNERIFYAVYDHVDGLDKARPVTINGLKVGRVVDIYLHPNGTENVIVKMTITNEELQLRKDTKAKIYSEDLLGGKSIQLIKGKSDEFIQVGDTLDSDIQLTIGEAVNAQVAPLRAKAESMISSIDTVLTLVQGFLNEETRNSFLETFSSIKRSFEISENTLTVVNSSVNQTQGDFEKIMSNVAQISENLKNNGDELDSIFGNVANLSDSLAKIEFTKTFESLNRTLSQTEEVMTKINSGDGTLGMLVNDTSLYHNLDITTAQLNRLILDLKYNPKRYINFSVFGSSKVYSEEEIQEMEKEAEAKRAAADKN